MNIVGLVLRALPDSFAELKQALANIAGVEVHDESVALGRLVVTVEDGEGYAVADSLTAINVLPQVLSLTLAYEHRDFNERTSQTQEA